MGRIGKGNQPVSADKRRKVNYLILWQRHNREKSTLTDMGNTQKKSQLYFFWATNPEEKQATNEGRKYRRKESAVSYADNTN